MYLINNIFYLGANIDSNYSAYKYLRVWIMNGTGVLFYATIFAILFNIVLMFTNMANEETVEKSKRHIKNIGVVSVILLSLRTIIRIVMIYFD